MKDDMPAIQIGFDVSWDDITGLFLRITGFEPLGTVEGSKVKGPPKPHPYGVLVVKGPSLPEDAIVSSHHPLSNASASMNIEHREDFVRAWTCLHKWELQDDEELLVVYQPIERHWLMKHFAGVLPKLHFMVFPSGSLERLSTRPKGDEVLNRPRPIAELRPSWSDRYW